MINHKLVSLLLNKGIVVIHPQYGNGVVMRTGLYQILSHEGQLAVKAKRLPFDAFVADNGAGSELRYLLSTTEHSLTPVKVLNRTPDQKALVLINSDTATPTSALIDQQELLIKVHHPKDVAAGTLVAYPDVNGTLLRKDLVQVRFPIVRRSVVLDIHELLRADTITEGLAIPGMPEGTGRIHELTPDHKALVYVGETSALITETEVARHILNSQLVTSPAIRAYYPFILSIAEKLATQGSFPNSTLSKVKDRGDFGKTLGELLIKMGVDLSLINECLRKVNLTVKPLLSRTHAAGSEETLALLRQRQEDFRYDPIPVHVFTLSMLLNNGVKLEPGDVSFQ